MANQFLDSEDRHRIPWIAARCLEAGLDQRAAARIWRREVAPIVYGNLLSIAGEWGAWNREWLIETVEQHRNFSRGPISWLLDHLRSLVGNCFLRATARCMRAMQDADEPPRQIAKELEWLAHHFFDMYRSPLPNTLELATVRYRWKTIFHAVFKPVFFTNSTPLHVMNARVENALARPPERL